ncbi:MAG: hypothetical protein U1E05_17810, partial [Patescibacteria group bacterium]|nr:hypothetical protein [Patescibacteria group bacterium]
GPTSPRVGFRFVLAGVVWGLAMLVRLHGVLLLPPIALWLGWHCGAFRHLPWRKAVTGGLVPLRLRWASAWFLAGVTTLVLGWPWLWLDPARNLSRYLLSGAGRHAVHVYYLGQVWADRDVPWHYPLLMFAWTVPLGLLALGICGWAAWLRHPIGRCDALPDGIRGDFGLIALAGSFLLVVFAWPGVPVYDGVRLFLPVFPLWAVFAGLGAKWLSRCWREADGPGVGGRDRRGLGRPLPHAARVGVIGLVVLLQGSGLILYHPCQTSYYNLLAGGLRGAECLGLEVTYWGDAVRESLLAEAARRAPGQPVLYGPNLAPFQAPAVAMSSPSLATSETAIVGWDDARPETASECRYALVYRRRADLGPVEWVLSHGELVLEVQVQGVWVARLMRLRDPMPPRRAEPSE